MKIAAFEESQSLRSPRLRVSMARVSRRYVLRPTNYLSVSISGIVPMDLNYDNHLERYLVKNPPPQQEDKAFGTFVTISISVTITIALELSGVINIDENFEACSSSGSTDEIQIDHDKSCFNGQQETNLNLSHRVLVPPNPEVADSNHRVQIDQCYGQPSEGAYFRAYPAMAPDAIKGGVLVGEWVVLTGGKEHGDGITWYEVINESPLVYSPEAYAYESAPNQYGWIASCFVE